MSQRGKTDCEFLEARIGNRLVYTKAALARFLHTLLLFRIFKLGPLFAAQLPGFATGGPWSPVLLRLVFGSHEDIFDKFRWKHLAKRYNLTKYRKNHIATGRYADDILAISNDF